MYADCVYASPKSFIIVVIYNFRVHIFTLNEIIDLLSIFRRSISAGIFKTGVVPVTVT